jgi:hypothetical protein
MSKAEWMKEATYQEVVGRSEKAGLHLHINFVVGRKFAAVVGHF